MFDVLQGQPLSGLLCGRSLERGALEFLRSTLTFLHCQPQEPMQQQHGIFTIPKQCPQTLILLWSSSGYSSTFLAFPALTFYNSDPTSHSYRGQASAGRGLPSSRLEAERMEGQTTIKQRRSLRWPCLNPSCQIEVVPKVCDETCGQCLNAWPGGCGPAGTSRLAPRASALRALGAKHLRTRALPHLRSSW